MLNNPYLYTILTILLWSTVATAFKIALSQISPIDLLVQASLASLVSIFLVVLLQKKQRLLFQFGRKDMLISAVTGFLNPTLYYLILFRAYDLLPAQEAQPLNWTWPVVLSVMSSIFFGLKFNIPKLIAIVFAFCGVMLIATSGDIRSFRLSNPEGDLLAIGSSIIWASYWILNLKDNRDPVVKLFWGFVFGNVFNLCVVVISGHAVLLTGKGLAAATYVGFFEMGITFVLWLNALSLAKDTTIITISAYLTPFLSLVFIGLIVGEKINISSILGLVLIVTGIVVQMLASSGKPLPNQKIT